LETVSDDWWIRGVYDDGVQNVGDEIRLGNVQAGLPVASDSPSGYSRPLFVSPFDPELGLNPYFFKEYLQNTGTASLLEQHRAAPVNPLVKLPQEPCSLGTSETKVPSTDEVFDTESSTATDPHLWSDSYHGPNESSLENRPSSLKLVPDLSSVSLSRLSSGSPREFIYDTPNELEAFLFEAPSSVSSSPPGERTYSFISTPSTSAAFGCRQYERNFNPE
jgi:hypothetical protein